MFKRLKKLDRSADLRVYTLSYWLIAHNVNFFVKEMENNTSGEVMNKGLAVLFFFNEIYEYECSLGVEVVLGRLCHAQRG